MHTRSAVSAYSSHCARTRGEGKLDGHENPGSEKLKGLESAAFSEDGGCAPAAVDLG
jgi:hypothetical protein